MPIEALIRDLEPCRDIARVAAVLLRHCRRHAAEIRRGHDSRPVSKAWLAVTSEACSWFRAQDSGEDFSVDAYREIADRLRTWEGAIRAAGDADISHPVVARAVAEGLHAASGHRFATMFRDHGHIRFHPGDPFPILSPELKRFFGADLSTPPERRGCPIDALASLGILPDDTRGLEIWMDFRASDLLADLSPEATIGVGVPSRGRRPEDVQVSIDDTTETFFGVEPADPRRQDDAIRGILATAAQVGVRILVFPELSVGDTGEQVIINWARSGEATVTDVVVCGSRHVEVDGERRNAARVVFKGGSDVVHYKFNRYAFGSPVISEDIAATPARITVNHFGPWPLTVLICKDMLELDVPSLLQHLGVRLLLVPAFSERTQIFDVGMRTFAFTGQAVAVLANIASGEGEHEPAAALLARPVNSSPVQQVMFREIEPPRLCLFSLDGAAPRALRVE